MSGMHGASCALSWLAVKRRGLLSEVEVWCCCSFSVLTIGSSVFDVSLWGWEACTTNDPLALAC